MLGSLQSPISKLARTLQAIVDEEATPGKAAAAEEAAPAEETAPAAEEAAPAEETATEE